MARKNTNQEPIPHPVVKWVGGKKQLLATLTSMAPKTFNRYYEPFCGGAALYFALTPKHAVLNDFNKELINLYTQIRDWPEQFMQQANNLEQEYNSLSSPEQKNDYYYARREEFNTSILLNDRSEETNLNMAALFLFLNKAGWNGVYRLNRAGLFNVPTGRHKTVKLFEADNIASVSSHLFHTRLSAGDFSLCVKDAQPGDFVFIDSPYYDTFTQYQAGGFSLNDHLRVFEMFEYLTSKHVYCMLTNSNTDFIKDKYRCYNQKVVRVQRSVNRNKDERHGEEVIITNYSPTLAAGYQRVELEQMSLF